MYLKIKCTVPYNLACSIQLKFIKQQLNNFIISLEIQSKSLEIQSKSLEI